MNKEEVVWTLLVEANIEPAITEVGNLSILIFLLLLFISS